jgi:DNA-binding NarL/FixJ family response regulator
MSITISIVEDNAGTREMLSKLFDRSPGLTCLRAYASGEDAVRGIPREPSEVAVVDINLPGMSGIECVARLKQLLPALQVLMLTTYEESDLIFGSLRAGANGYLLKTMPAGELVEAVRQVRAGGAPMSMQIARKVIAHFHGTKSEPGRMEQLTNRENEVLGLLAKGHLYKEISEQLGISMSTVRTHIHTIYEKLHVQTRTEAVVKFIDRK